MNLPFDVEEIPVEYRQLIKDGLASRASEGRFDVVLPLLESLINEGTKNGHIYTAQAYCSVEDIRNTCLLYTSPSPRDGLLSRMPSSA